MKAAEPLTNEQGAVAAMTAIFLLVLLCAALCALALMWLGPDE